MTPRGTNGRGTRAESATALSGMRLTELLDEVQERLAVVGQTQARVQHLLDAFLTVSTGLDSPRHQRFECREVWQRQVTRTA